MSDIMGTLFRFLGESMFNKKCLSILIASFILFGVLVGCNRNVGEKLEDKYPENFYPLEGNRSLSCISAGRSYDPDFVLDSKGYPHVVWEYDQYIYYLKWDGENWVCDDGSIFKSDEWRRWENPANVSRQISQRNEKPSIRLDNSDNPHVVWHTLLRNDDENYWFNIVYIKWDGKNWVCADGSKYNGEDDKSSNPANISRNHKSAGNVKLELDSKGYPHLAWEVGHIGPYSSTDTDVYYVRWNGETWVCADGSIYNPDDMTILNPANLTKNELKSFDISLVLDKDDNPHISWTDQNTENRLDILYVTHNGTDWVTADGSIFNPHMLNANVSNSPSISEESSLVISSRGDPHIAFYDQSFEGWHTVYLHHDGKDWKCGDGSTFENEYLAIENPTVVALYSSSGWGSVLKLDKNNNPNFFWRHFDFDTKIVNPMFIKFDGEKMVTVTGEVFDKFDSESSAIEGFTEVDECKMQLDKNDYPHLLFQNDRSIHYMRWNGREWEVLK